MLSSGGHAKIAQTEVAWKHHGLATTAELQQEADNNVLPILVKHHVNTAPLGLAMPLVILCAHAAELYHTRGMPFKSGGGLDELREVIGNLIGAYSNQWGGEGFEQGQIK